MLPSKLPINLTDKFGKFSERRAPHIIAQMNDVHIKCVKAFGEFVWHKHDETDELFFIHKGELTIQYRDGDVHLRAGDLHVVRRGLEHRPVAKEECEVVLIEPAGTVNTGNAGGEMTAHVEPWI
jgi:mannose-6-phosphate isomerase-like protein (cupin superfamily)